jgi:hypothetical protein
MDDPGSSMPDRASDPPRDDGAARAKPAAPGRRRPRFAVHSLRARVALGVALPLVVALSGFSYAHYLRERSLLGDQLRSTAAQLGAVMTGGLRHAMMTNDSSTLSQILDDIAGMEVIERVRIVDAGGVVRHDSAGEEVGQADSLSAPGCSECHAFPPAERPHAVLLSSAQGTLRIATPIRNEAACTGCHAAGPAHLGVLLADVPLQTLEAGLVTDLTWSLAASVGVAVAISLAVILLVQGLIVRRLEAMQAPLARYAGGDFTVRLAASTLWRNRPPSAASAARPSSWSAAPWPSGSNESCGSMPPSRSASASRGNSTMGWRRSWPTSAPKPWRSGSC